MANELTKEQKEYDAIRALLIAKTKEEAADIAGVSRQTLYNYMKDEGFMNKLNMAQEERDKQIAQTMEEAVPKALAYLVSVIEKEDDPYADIFGGGVTTKDRIDAARVILTSPAAKLVMADK